MTMKTKRIILGIIIFNKEMFTIRGLIFSINTLIFCYTITR